MSSERPPVSQARLLEHGVRLSIVALLARYDEISFSRLKELLDQTDGNLGAQLRKLEDAGLISVRKEFRDRRPVSWYGITRRGRRTLRAHLDVLRAVIRLADPT